MTQLYCLYHLDPSYATAVGDPLLAVIRSQSEQEAVGICQHVEAPTGLIAVPHSENTWDPFQTQPVFSGVSPGLAPQTALSAH